MDADTYRNAVVLCAAAAGFLADAELPLQELVRAIDHSDAVAPLLDPTLWLQKRTAMAEDKELFLAAMQLQAIGKRLRALERRPGQEVIRGVKP